MPGIADHIRSVDHVSPVSGLSVPDTPLQDELPQDGGIVPWLWIAAWLLGWAILLAFAAFWIGDDGVSAGDIWIWIGLWLAGGLAVAGMMVRMAAKDTERAYTLRRLSTARQEIAKLEAQLQTSTRSLFSATQTLTEATDLLLEQVDTSRDDLRNQIRSAQDLADSLRTQTEGLVTARQSYIDDIRSDLAPAPPADAPLPEPEPIATSSSPDIPVRRSLDDPSGETHGVDTVDIDEPEKLPPLGLRPAPDVEEAFLAPEEAKAPAAPIAAAVAEGRTAWEWKDMLSNVDAAVKPDEDVERVVTSLRDARLAPEAVVDDGNAMDALDTWDRAGLAAMGQLLSIRFDEPARVYRDLLRADAELEAAVKRFAETRASRLSTTARPAREADVATDAGRAWLFVQAVLAL